jgi:hypothetical protein
MRTALTRSATLLVLVSALSACATRSPARSTPVSHDVLTEQDLVNQGFTTAMDAIRALRGNWLETHGTNSFFTPVTVRVFVDNDEVGGVDELSSIMIASVVYIRHYDGVTATARWGIGHGAGVIYISTHTGSQPI